MKRDKKLDELLTYFNFEKVRVVMKALNWTWGNNEDPPSIYQMIKVVEQLFEDTNKKDLSIVGTGGFKLTKEIDDDDHTIYELFFIVEYWDTE